MTGLLSYLSLTLRLHFRQKLALFYSFLFPLIFLGAFRALYRWETIPLARHVGELLTVVILSGACLGLPVILVAERERGVWRRYRLAPVPTSTLVAGMILARFILLVASAVLLIALAIAAGMPPPNHPLQLAAGFAVVAFAFSGLGLLLAMVASNVQAAQALGQCVFLPMLVFGGVVVQVASLPAWSQQLSTYLPGRYSVELMQACANGAGLGGKGFALAALLLMGSSAFFSAFRMFRWDTQARRESGRGFQWTGLVAVAWISVGVMAGKFNSRQPAADFESAVASDEFTPPTPPGTAPAAAPTPPPALPPAAAPIARAEPRGWRDLSPADLAAIEIVLPPDEGVVAPMPLPGETADANTVDWLDYVRPRLPDWTAGKVADPEQRVRNYLYAAAVPDVVQMDTFERFFPPHRPGISGPIHASGGPPPDPGVDRPASGSGQPGGIRSGRRTRYRGAHQRVRCGEGAGPLLCDEVPAPGPGRGAPPLTETPGINFPLPWGPPRKWCALTMILTPP